MISTKNLASLPDRNKLKGICKSLAVLDAVFSEDWSNRYYLYNSKWADNEEFAEMRNGQGDNVLILFLNEGSVINGMCHEHYPKDKDKITKGLPVIYHEFIFGEPVRSIGTTFCIWTVEQSKWTLGEVEDFSDGSGEVLIIYDCNPKTYTDWATEYYEVEFSVDALDVIQKVYKNEPLTEEMVYKLSKDFKHWKELKLDLEEINYPYRLK